MKTFIINHSKNVINNQKIPYSYKNPDGSNSFSNSAIFLSVDYK